MAMKKSQNFLARHLRAKAGHLGRETEEIKRIAAEVGLSVHLVQSLAYGRRAFTKANRESIKGAVGA